MQLLINFKKVVFLERWSSAKSVKHRHQKCQQELGIGYCDYTTATVEREIHSVLLKSSCSGL